MADPWAAFEPAKAADPWAQFERAGPPTGAGIVANVGAGANDWIASVGGAPVDATAWFLNKAAEYFGRKEPLIAEGAPGSSNSIRSAMGLIGADPRNVAANTTGEKIARDVGAAIPATVAPFLGARAAIERGATGMLPRLLGGPGGPGQSGAQTAAGAIGNAAVGAGGVLGGKAAESLVPEDSPYRSGLNLAGQLAGGAATAGGLSLGANALARVAQPNVSPGIRLLIDEGITPTPGQIMGGRIGRTEEALTSVPIAGDAIKAARIRANEQFNRGAINRALSPIGEKLDDGIQIGREAIATAGDKITAYYTNLVPGLTAKVDRQFADDLTKLTGLTRLMPEPQAKQFATLLDETIVSKLSPNGTMLGESFKDAESTLGTFAREYIHSSNASERQLGKAAQQLQVTLREWLARGNPDKADELAKVNAAFARMLRVEGAAGKPGAEPGVFTPAQLQSAVRQLDPTLRKRATARGEALMQDYADAGRDVLGARLPDSGTPYRTLTAFLGGAGMGLNPAAAGMAAAGGLGASALYSPAGQAVIAKALTERPPWAADLADIIRGFSPPLGAAASYPTWGALAP